jgi:hypothetical protein
VDAPGEVSTYSKVSVNGTASYVFSTGGLTVTTWQQENGTGLLHPAATVATVTVNGGTLTTEGDFILSALAVNAGTVYANHIRTGSGAAITAATLNGATAVLDGQKSPRARTWTAVTLDKGTIKAEVGIVTITTLAMPTEGKWAFQRVE